MSLPYLTPLQMGGSRGVDWISVGVWQGRMKVAWTLGGGAPTIIVSQGK